MSSWRQHRQQPESHGGQDRAVAWRWHPQPTNKQTTPNRAQAYSTAGDCCRRPSRVSSTHCRRMWVPHSRSASQGVYLKQQEINHKEINCNGPKEAPISTM